MSTTDFVESAKLDDEKRVSEEISSSKSIDGESEDEHSQLLSKDIRPAAERRLVRKLDFRLMPLVVLIYILNYIDVRLTFVSKGCFVYDRYVENFSRICKIEWI